MKKITFLLTLFFIFIGFNANAQYGCATGVAIADGFTANAITTPGNAGVEDWNSPNPASSCSSNSSYWDDDVYMFTYTAGANDEEISMSTFTRNSWNGLGIFTTCTGTALDDCIDSSSSSSSNVAHTVTATILANQTVYIAVGQWGAPNGLDFDVTAFTVIPLVNPPNCDSSLTDTTNIALSGDISWSAATGGATGYNLIAGTTMGGNDVLALTDVGNVTTYSLGTLIANTTYYVTITPYNVNGDATGCLEQAFTTVPPPPANDDCSGAIALTPGAMFGTNPIDGTVISATLGSETVSCGLIGPGVWYSIVVPADGNIIIETGPDAGTGDTGFDSVIEAFSGTCGARVSIACDDDGSPANSFSLLDLTGLTPSSTIYVLVWEYAGNDVEPFAISAYNATLGLDDNKIEGFKFYPNPVNDILNLRAQSNIQNVSIYNMLGQEVSRISPNAFSSDVDMSALQTGVYFVNVTINNITETIRVIKQ